MKYFTILLDDNAHTAFYLVKANTEEEALEVFTLNQVTGCEKKQGAWIIKDFGDSKYDKTFFSIDEIINKYWKTTTQRFEIQEIDFKPEIQVQEVFCSIEKDYDQ
jgi:hypothetical protein